MSTVGLTEALRLCCCHGHLDGLTLDEMAALDAACPTATAIERIVADRVREAEQRAWEKGVRQAIEWLQADYPPFSGPDWRESGVEWIGDRLAEARADRLAGDER